MLSAAPRASLILPSSSPNYPRASRIGWTHSRHCPFLNENAFHRTKGSVNVRTCIIESINHCTFLSPLLQNDREGDPEENALVKYEFIFYLRISQTTKFFIRIASALNKTDTCLITLFLDNPGKGRGIHRGGRRCVQWGPHSLGHQWW